MVISCPHCSTRFKVPEEKFKQGAIKVRCSKCKNIFNASPGEISQSEIAATSTPNLRDQGDVNLDFDIGEESPVEKRRVAPPPPAPKLPQTPPPNLLSGDNILEIPRAKPAAKPVVEKSPPPFLVEENPLTQDFAMAEPDPQGFPDHFSSEIKNIDDELNVLLDTPNGMSEDIPLTMPQDIDLNALAARKAPTLQKTTDDGIELLDNLNQLDEKPQRMPLLAEKKESPPPRPKIQAPSLGLPIEPYEEFETAKSGGHLGKILWVVLLMVAVGGIGFGVSTGLVDLTQLKNTLTGIVLSPRAEKTSKAQGDSPSQISVLHTTTLMITTVDQIPVLVISGEVRNGYPTPQSFLRVKAQMLNHEGQVLSEKEVFAGNFFTRDEIYYFTDQEMIDRKYSDSGKSLANLNVSPDTVIPFQIIMMNPDPKWEQFKVTSSGSQAAASGS